MAKEAFPEYSTKNLEKDKAWVFPNGRIKFMENQTRFIFDFKVKSVICDKDTLNQERLALYQNYLWSN